MIDNFQMTWAVICCTLSLANYPELGVKKLKPKLEPEYINTHI
ncbi:hypothetical protein DesyoDRAFT_2819 [Desulfosporosinus youngiae DSM 17734]|uniref:Uncharacterized protein n=1 Tax=Desulfosporosinus youngiae DSM 17734 TaxID=768710 RepID=H5XVD2_9FIRM|nr:hypothetical protein DesyoDRAFT_2819 [Desulfosporosinus youngiae DSM 17734]